jgi:hypothetical protein
MFHTNVKVWGGRFTHFFLPPSCRNARQNRHTLTRSIVAFSVACESANATHSSSPYPAIFLYGLRCKVKMTALPSALEAELHATHCKEARGMRQWYSSFLFARVPPDVIYLQLCTSPGCWCIFLVYNLSTIYIYIYKWVYVCVRVCLLVCSGITLERLERFQPNLVHIWLYVCVRILCIYYIYFIS